MIAADAIADGSMVYRAANGRVSVAGSSQIGTAASATSGAGQPILVEPFVVGDGGGGPGTLQATTDLGNTTTNSIEILDIGDGLICKSPNGIRWLFSPSNAGEPVWTPL